MGLLDKTLRKTGQERKKSTPAPEKTEEKPAVEWLGRSLRDRSKALVDKIDLESQYARLEAMSQKADLPPPPKTSLRDRARRFLTGLAAPVIGGAGKPAAATAGERPKMSLRQRAQLLLKKITGTGGTGEQGNLPGGTDGRPPSGPEHRADTEVEEPYELHEPTFFPWHALADDGTLVGHVAFGEEPHPEHIDLTAESVSLSAEPVSPKEEKSTLSEFADTIGRITENLKNLHIQLDSGNFIREAVQPGPAQAVSAAAPAEPPLISHHVPIEGAAAGPQVNVSDGGGTAANIEVTGAAAQEKPRDVFWPKELPLDLPARDIRMNADGTLSVVPGPFQLPYLAEDIAPPESDISHFTRNLKNAELFIAEGELQLTRIIYERLLAKIIDEEAQRKIRANLDALDQYKKSHDWGNFMPLPPWMNQRNPWQDFKPPQLNISEMPVEAKNITINLDKGFFEIAKAIFEQQKELIQTLGKEKKEEDAAAEGEIGEEEGGEAEQEAAAPDEAEAQEDERRKEDRRKGGPDARGEGAPERRSGRDRRDDAAEEAGAGDEGGAPEEKAAQEKEQPPENAPPPPLAADGASAAPEEEPPPPQAEPMADGVMEPPKIPEMSPDGQAMAGEGDEGGEGKEKEEENKVQEIRGVLELKTPDQEDTPFLTLTYDFTKIPHAYRLAKDNGIFEYAYYKYKPMLVKAHQFIKRKQITRALNYYRVIREQQIPTEFRHMVDRNIKDITEYLQKYLVTRQN